MGKKRKREYSILQVIIASFGFGAYSMFGAIYNSYVPLILDAKLNQLGSVVLSATMISSLTGLIMSIDNLFGLIFLPVFGRKSDQTRSRFGKRLPFLLVGIPVSAVLFVIIPLAGRIAGVAGILVMMAVIIVFNFVMSTWRSPSVAIMPDLVPSQYQSEGNAIVNMVMVFVNIVAMCSATIMGHWGFKDAISSGDYVSVFAFGSVTAVLSLVLILTCVKWPDNRGEALVAQTAEKAKKENIRSINLPSSVKKSLYFMMIALFFISGSIDGGSTYATLYATKTLNLDVARVTMLSSVAAMGSVAAAVPAGMMGTKIGRKKTILIGLALLTAGRAGYLLLPYTGDLIYLLYTVIGFVSAAAMMLVNINTLPIMLSIGGKERFGAFTGYYYTATFSAAVICPSVIGYLIGATGTYHTLQIFCIAVQIIAAILILMVKHGEANGAEAVATGKQ